MVCLGISDQTMEMVTQAAISTLHGCGSFSFFYFPISFLE